jgi:hypothetical protein
MQTLKKDDVAKMQAYLLSKKPTAIDKKIAYGPKPDKKVSNAKKNKKQGKRGR